MITVENLFNCIFEPLFVCFDTLDLNNNFVQFIYLSTFIVLIISLFLDWFYHK